MTKSINVAALSHNPPLLEERGRARLEREFTHPPGFLLPQEHKLEPLSPCAPAKGGAQRGPHTPARARRLRLPALRGNGRPAAPYERDERTSFGRIAARGADGAS